MKQLKIAIVLLTIFTFQFNSYSQDYEPLIQKAMEFYNNGQFDSAVILFEETLPLVEQKYGNTDTVHYAKQLEFTGLSCEFSQQYDKAEKYYLQVRSIYQALQDTINENYAYALGNLAILYQTIGNHKVALFYYQQDLIITKEVYGSKSPEYAASLSNLAMHNRIMGNYETAQPMLEEALVIIKEVYGTEHSYYATALNNLAFHNSDMGNYEAALILEKEACKVQKKATCTKNSSYIIYLNNFATIHKNMGNYEASLPLYEESVKISKEVLNHTDPAYSTNINNLAALYYYLGNFDAAIPLYKEAIEIDKEVLGTNHPHYARNISNLGMVFQSIGNYQAAIPLYEEAIKINKEGLGEQHPSYARVLIKLGSIYRDMGDYEAAIPLIEKAIKIDTVILGSEHPEYARDISNLGKLYKDMGNYEAALPLFEEAKSIMLVTLGPKHSEYASTLINLATLNDVMKNFEVALPQFKEANEIINQNIKENFSVLTQNEKRKYYFTLENNIGIYLSFIKKIYSIYPESSGDAFDNELFLKGLILSSSAILQQVVLESSDSSLIIDYEQLRMLRRQIASQKLKPLLERRADLAEKEQQANNLERDLTLRSQAFNTMQSFVNIKWKDVRNQLAENEVAIEFISYNYYDKKLSDSTYYCALLIRKNNASPEMIYLCDESKLLEAIPQPGASNRNINYLYQEPKLYELIWQPIDSLLEGVNTVYFAPSGLLNSVSLAAISTPDNKQLIEKYKLVQLSSTRTLAMEQEPISLTDAAIYGGIIYDTDTLTLLNKTEDYKDDAYDILAYNRSYTGDYRSGFNYLPGSEKEVESISKMLAKNKINVSNYSGTDAIEESFLVLSGNDSPTIIHLSTHGFYFPDTVSEENRKNIMYSSTGEIRFRYNDDPLLRSGLLMSGANLAWKGEAIPDHLEDGILTAKEVSNMNLMNTELVVLSACQSGLGDVKGSEGVEGLQRGFKMAGVRYITMSLWQVPDKETTEFMETFYANWLEGDDIHKAFRATQITMRNKYKDEPFKWAGFVLME